MDSHKDLVPHIENTVVGKPCFFGSVVDRAAGNGILGDFLPNLSGLVGISHQGLCCGDISFPTAFAKVLLLSAFVPILHNMGIATVRACRFIWNGKCV